MTHPAPPIVRQANALMRDIELAVTRFPRRFRQGVGNDLRRQAMQVARIAAKAWRDREHQGPWVSQLSEQVDDLKLTMQLGKEIHAFASFAQFEDLARKASDIGRQVGGWMKQLHPNGQDGAPAVSRQRAKTLSTRAASDFEANR